MSSCYTSTRWMKYGGMAAGAAAMTAYCILGNEPGPVVRIMYGILMLALISLLGLGAAQYYSIYRMNQALALLNRDLKPEEFLAAFTPVAARWKKGTIQEIMAWVYVSSGQLAAGRSSQAMDTLKALKPEELKNRRYAAHGLVFNQMFQCLHQEKDAEGEEQILMKIRDLSVQMEGRQPALAAHLKNNARLFEEYVNLDAGREVDCLYLEEEIRLSANALHRNQVHMVLADAYGRAGNAEQEQSHLRAAAEEGSQTDLARQARARLAAG